MQWNASMQWNAYSNFVSDCNDTVIQIEALKAFTTLTEVKNFEFSFVCLKCSYTHEIKLYYFVIDINYERSI